MKDFAGSIAVDELYDGPFCVLWVVDHRTFKRITYRVLRRDPKRDDVTACFRRFQAALERRGLSLRGITTAGSALDPEPLAAVFGDVPHQVCTFHVLRELVQATLGAVARVRKDRTAGKPALAKLARLRRRVRRFRRLGSALKELFSGDLEKALVLLDDRLLGATSNAVERGNRRYRKMQRSVYRVRTESAINGRIALDLQREARARDRTETTYTLHRARAA